VEAGACLRSCRPRSHGHQAKTHRRVSPNAGSAAPGRLQFHYAWKKSRTGRPGARKTRISSSQKGTSECPIAASG